MPISTLSWFLEFLIFFLEIFIIPELASCILSVGPQTDAARGFLADSPRRNPRLPRSNPVPDLFVLPSTMVVNNRGHFFHE